MNIRIWRGSKFYKQFSTRSFYIDNDKHAKEIIERARKFEDFTGDLSDYVVLMCDSMLCPIIFKKVECEFQSHTGRWLPLIILDEKTKDNKVQYSDLNTKIIGYLVTIEELFKKKQEQYQNNTNTLADFEQGALIRYGKGDLKTMFETAKDYVNKHIAYLYSNNINDKKIDESLNDIIVYSLIMKFMKEKSDTK